MTYGFSYSMARKFAFEYAVKNKISVPETWKIDMEAGIDWVRGFLRRHPDVSLRRPENISLARIRGFNEESVQDFFFKFKKVTGEIFVPAKGHLQFG